MKNIWIAAGIIISSVTAAQAQRALSGGTGTQSAGQNTLKPICNITQIAEIGGTGTQSAGQNVLRPFAVTRFNIGGTGTQSAGQNVLKP